MPDQNGIVWDDEQDVVSGGSSGIGQPGAPSALQRRNPQPDHDGIVWDQPAQAAAPKQPSAFGRFSEALKKPIKGAVQGLGRMVRDPLHEVPSFIDNTIEAQGNQFLEAAEAYGYGPPDNQHERTGPVFMNDPKANTRAAEKLGLAFMPVIGPMFNEAVDKAHEDDLAGSLGSTAGNLAVLEGPKLGPRAVRGAAKFAGEGAKAIARTGYGQAFKMKGKTPAQRAAFIEEGLSHGVDLSPEGIERARDAVSIGEDTKNAIIGNDPTRPIKVGPVVKGSREVEARYANQVNPGPDVNAVRSVRQGFLESDRPGGPIARPGKAARDMTAREAQVIKQGTYRSLGERAYGGERTAGVEAEKRMAHDINDALTTEFPDLAPVNKMQGNLLGVIKNGIRRLGQTQNANATGAAGHLAAVGTVVDGMQGGAIGGASGLTLKVLRSPELKSKVAISLYKAGGKLRSFGEAKGLVERGIENITNRLERAQPSIPALSIKHLNTGESLPTTPDHVVTLMAQAIKDSPDKTLKGAVEYAKANFGDEWNIGTNKRGSKSVDPATAYKKAKVWLKTNPDIPPTAEYQARTDKGAPIRDWYRGELREYAEQAGIADHEMRSVINVAAAASPQVPVERAVNAAIDAIKRKNTGQDPMPALKGIVNKNAVMGVLEGDKPSGRKVQPFGESSNVAFGGPEPKMSVVDTHALASAGNFPPTANDAQFRFTDARQRAEANRIGARRVDEAQAMNWGGRQQELGVESKNTKNYVDFIRNAIDTHGGPGAVFPKDTEFDFGNNVLPFEKGPNETVGKVAAAYNAAKGFKPPTEIKASKIDLDRARAIAKAYDAMPASDPRAKPAYDALKREVKEQWDAAEKAGYTFEPWNREGQPYRNSAEMRADVRNNKHLFFFQGGEPHPFLNDSFKGDLTYNDAFRAVHDLFGHSKNGLEFGPKGEEAAWKTHVQMFSPLAAKAMTSETRGQNSWVNFGPHNPEALPLPDRPYAQQKAALLPDEFTTDKAHFVASIVRLKNGMILQSKAVPIMSGKMPTQLSILEEHGVPVSDVIDSGFKVGSEYQWDSGGGTIGRGEETLGGHESKRAMQ